MLFGNKTVGLVGVRRFDKLVITLALVRGVLEIGFVVFNLLGAALVVGL